MQKNIYLSVGTGMAIIKANDNIKQMAKEYNLLPHVGILL